MDDNTPKAGEEDDSYVIEDTGSSIEEFEREMHEAAEEAAQAGEASDQAAAAAKDRREQNRLLQDRGLRPLADSANFPKPPHQDAHDFFKYAPAARGKEIP